MSAGGRKRLHPERVHADPAPRAASFGVFMIVVLLIALGIGLWWAGGLGLLMRAIDGLR